MSNLWKTLNGIQYLKSLETEAWRIVEDQSKSYTRSMVDTEEEHEILEQLLDENKPTLKLYGDELALKGLHYLLFTPFRYPPLKTGSRFGKSTERNLCYAALELETAMCEKAYHRFRFLLASTGNIGDKTVNATAFKINIFSQRAIDLCTAPFSKYRDYITSPISYQDSQELGSNMRQDGVEIFISYSSRSKKNGKNVNIFSPNAFSKEQVVEKTFQHYTCYFNKKSVEFYPLISTSGVRPIVFDVETFYIDDRFPTL